MSDSNLSAYVADDTFSRPSTPSKAYLSAHPTPTLESQPQSDSQPLSQDIPAIGLTNVSVPYDTQAWNDEFLANMGPVMLEMQPTPPMAPVSADGMGATPGMTSGLGGIPLDSPFDYTSGSGLDLGMTGNGAMFNYAVPPQFSGDNNGLTMQSQYLVPTAQPLYHPYGNGVAGFQPQPALTVSGSVPNSQGGSPSTSSSNSLERSGSFSESLRQARPKRKLTTEDKRTICEKYNAAQGRLRQEDLAQDYGVDRSTISKILAQEARWTKSADDNDESGAALPSPAKLIRSEKLRFPQIEDRMHQYFDSLIMHGSEVRDQDAREQAKLFSKEYGLDQFKCSTKWWESFKTRRLKNGRALPISGFKYGHYDLSHMSPAAAALSRSQSVRSDISSLAMEPINLPTSVAITPSMSMGNLSQTLTPTRQRSQSSPQVPWDQHPQLQHPHPPQHPQPMQLSPALSPSFGKAPRTIFTSVPLGRQKSYNGSSTTPTRPSTLSRTYSVQGSSRPSPHKGLGASAFGLSQPLTNSPLSTPLMTARSGDKTLTTTTPTAANPTGPVTTPADAPTMPMVPQTSAQMQQALQQPHPHPQHLQQSFIDPQRGYSTISPNMSESGESTATVSFGLPPMTPITPASAHGSATFPNTDYGDMMQHNEFQTQATAVPQQVAYAQGQLQPPSSQPIQHSVSQPLMGQTHAAHLTSYPLHATGSDHALAAPFVNLRLDAQPPVGQHYVVSPHQLAAQGKPIYPMYTPVDQAYYQPQPEPQTTWFY